MAVQMLGIKTKFTDDQGRPLIGGSVHTYYAGTSLPQDTFSDPELTVPNTNPVILDDTGSADIFLKGAYRIRVFDKSGRFIEEQDNVTQTANESDVSGLLAIVNTNEETRALGLNGFDLINSFELGATITQRNQALRHTSDGKLYRWAGDLPKVVPTNSTPTSSGGMGVNAWLEVSDVALRQDLANPDMGALMVARNVVAVDSIADLLALPESARREDLQFSVVSFYDGSHQGGGTFVWDSSKSKSEANGGTIVDPDNLDGFDGTPNTVSGYLTAQGSGTGVGCFVATDAINKVSVDRFGAVGDGVADDRASIQKTISYIESTGDIKTLTAGSGNVYLLKTTSVEPTYGDTVGIYINKLNKVHVNFNDATIRLDSGITHNVDAVLSLAPDKAADASAYAFADVRNIVITGGGIAKAGLKSTYRKIAYCTFKNMLIGDLDGVGFYTDGYVINVEKIRVQGAGKNGIGFYFICQSGGANTGYLVSNCTVAYAGLTGFKMAGSSGHTYSHINNCHADFVGRDGNRNTIPENIENSYAYDFLSTRGLVTTSLGAEYCGKILRLSRAVTVNGLHAVGCGHSDGTTELESAIHVAGFAEKTTLSGIDIHASQSPFTHQLLVSNPNAYNKNQVTILDGSIPTSQVAYTGTATSTMLPLVTSPEDLYYGGFRRGSGDVVVTGGNKYNTRGTNEDLYLVHEQTFSIKVREKGVVQDILSVQNFRSKHLGVYFEIYQVVDLAAPKTVVKHTGGVWMYEWGYDTPELTSDVGYTGEPPSVAYDDSSKTLKAVLPQTGSSYFIKVTALPSSSSIGYPAVFSWGDKDSFVEIDAPVGE